MVIDRHSPAAAQCRVFLNTNEPKKTRWSYSLLIWYFLYTNTSKGVTSESPAFMGAEEVEGLCETNKGFRASVEGSGKVNKSHLAYS